MPTFVGIDVSKHNFHSCIISDSLTNPFHQHFTMNKHGFSSFLNSISRFDPANTFFAIESTGPYHFNLSSFLNSNGFNVVLINPLLISNFSKLNLRLTKTDKVDAYSIASYIQSFHAKFFDDSSHFKSYPSNLYPLKELSRKREDLVNRKRKLMSDVEKLLTITSPELESFVNVSSASILNLLAHFPSANAINGADVKEIEAFLKGRGRASKISAKDIKAMAKEPIGNATKATGKVPSMTIKESFL